MIIMAYKDKNRKCWIGSINYKSVDGSKKRIRKYGFSTKKDAEIWERDNQMINEESIFSSNPTIDEALSNVLKIKKNTNKLQTYINYRATYINHIKPYFSKKRMQDISKLLIQSWMQEQLIKGHSKNLVNTNMIVFQTLYKAAMSLYNVTTNPFENIKKYQIEKVSTTNSKIDFYTLEEFKKLDEVIDNLMYRTLFHILYFCGLRRGECLALTWNDISFKNQTIDINKTVNQNVKGTSFVINSPKNRSSIRTISVDKETMKLIYNLYQQYNSMYKIFDSSMYLFKMEQPLSSTIIRKTLEKYTTLAGIKKIRLHDFRHSHASLLINNGATPLLVAKRLGHSDIKMTLNTYSHLFENEEKKLIEMIDNL